MAYLPLANILHPKFRSVLNALGIGMAICMLVTLGGLSRGSLLEIAQRWESVSADVIVFPKGSGDGATLRSGSLLNDKYAELIRTRCAGDQCSLPNPAPDRPKCSPKSTPLFTFHPWPP